MNDKLRTTIKKLEAKNNSTDICSYFMEKEETNPYK